MANTKAFKVKNGLELQEYAKSINDTAVDVFVYDTSKDSDGGAWRHRTQNTSWYNETLNTVTRGSRKEFPAVAVIVGTSTGVTIYDGDDPDLPMWMVFTEVDGNLLGHPSVGLNTSVSAINGEICVGRDNTNSTHSGIRIIRFVADNAYRVITGTYDNTWIKGLSYRNSGGGYASGDPFTGSIVSPNVNDVAMTVLPNAPIDDATGLAIPTIAVATAGGVSVIKDDRTVVDITHTASVYYGAKDISFHGNQVSYASQQSGGSTTYWRKVFIDIPNSDVSGAYAHNIPGATVYDARGLNANSNVVLNTNSDLGDATNNIQDAVHAKAVGFTDKLTLLDIDSFSGTGAPSASGSMVAYTTSDYATGWMNGNIQMAVMSDTDATNVSYNNTVTNPDFASGITGYTANNATLAYDSGNARMSVTPTALYGGALQTLPAASNGKRYIFGATITTTVVNQNIRVQISGIGATQPSQIYNEAGTQVVWGIYDSSGGTPTLQFSSYDGTNYNQTFYVDNVFFSEAEEDRSVYQDALQVFGNVTKSAVITGADLVAYSGWSASNYLEQPPNPNLIFNTGDFCIMGWVKKDATASYRRFFSLQDPTGVQGDNDAINIKFANESTGGELYAYLGDAEGSIPTSNVDYIEPGNWGHFALVRQNMTYYMYVNGNLIESKASTQSKGSSTSVVRIGQGADGLESFSSGSCALFRVSTTAPSAEQITKIYEDEKMLFQEGAQATLYGSSDAVTALGYDDSTGLLHVGTSSGRSVFQGLRRVDNTTDAVGTTISASNSMIAED